ncbi:hypothetical protein Y032_0010g1027 [Ancylostoma ceylanicum]|nr:hypothetical protein Y032_0010g1027 [Ancylostoma ceylanicum]
MTDFFTLQNSITLYCRFFGVVRCTGSRVESGLRLLVSGSDGKIALERFALASAGIFHMLHLGARWKHDDV